MTPDDAADLNDVMAPTEQGHPDRGERAKESKHLHDDLDRRTQHERDIVDAQPAGSEKC